MKRKSIARFHEHFSGPRHLTAIAFRFVSLIAPVAVIAFLGCAALEAHGSGHLHIGHLGTLAAGTATVDLESISKDILKFTDATKGTLAEQSARLLAIEQKMTAPGGSRNGNESVEAIGGLLTKSDGFTHLAKGGRTSGQVKVGTFHKTAIINATGLDQPLVPMYRVPGIVMPGQQRLTIRDLMPSFPVTSNLIAYTKESGSTDAAAPQAGENVLKAESGLTFSLQNSPVQTLAHWIPASRQIIEDAPALEAYINARLTYFLKLAEENQLLSGDGSGQNLSGLIANSTLFDTSGVNTSTDTYIDILEQAIAQVQQNSNFQADGIVLNNLDWSAIQRIKTVGSASSGQYIYADPHSATTPQLWGLPVVSTKSMARGQFLVGAFRLGAAIWDRDDATVEVSREHADFFIRNMCAILCEERLALTIFRNDALCYGGFPFGS